MLPNICIPRKNFRIYQNNLSIFRPRNILLRPGSIPFNIQKINGGYKFSTSLFLPFQQPEGRCTDIMNDVVQAS